MGENIFLFTLFSSLGDALIISNVVTKARTVGERCFIAHLNNPHIDAFLPQELKHCSFNVLSSNGLFLLWQALISERRKGAIVFGIQQAPGSLRGFYFLSLLKKIAAVDYVVDDNLYDADIVIPKKSGYILDIHLDQVCKLSGKEIKGESRSLSLPEVLRSSVLDVDPFLVGIHPWSRRWKEPAFVWSFEQWATFIELAATTCNSSFIVFGRDPRFDEFQSFLKYRLPHNVYAKIIFSPVRNIQEMTGVISRCQILISVNTGVVHIAYALQKRMVILNGPTFDFWIPKSDNIRSIKDTYALYDGSDKQGNNLKFPMVSRIDVNMVLKEFLGLIGSR
ncbi:MAG: hypothetical protein HQL14_08205 [Candidatus Omnitrophica bacterium]|nr:hypothetical protein [Candidatus Omnitrophota bacterium]